MKRHLIEDHQSIWKDKESKKQLKRIKTPSSLRRIITQVERETASPFSKFMRKHALFLTILIPTIALLAIGGTFLLKLFFTDVEPVDGGKNEPATIQGEVE